MPTQKKKPATTKPTTAKRTSAAKTASSGSAAQKKSADKGTVGTAASTRKAAGSTLPKRQFADNPLVFLVMPYILSFLGLFLLVCFLFPEKMNVLGAFAGMLCGVFSFGAWVIPAYFLIQAVFWKRDAKTGRLHAKVIFAIICLIFVAVAGQLMYLASPSDQIDANLTGYHAAPLYEAGKIYTGGGVVGGIVGNALSALTGWGAGIITAFVLLVFGLALFNITPLDVFVFFRQKIATALYDHRLAREKEQYLEELDRPRDIPPAPLDETRHIRNPGLTDAPPKAAGSFRRRKSVDIPLSEAEPDESLSDSDTGVVIPPTERMDVVAKKIAPEPVLPDDDAYERARTDRDAQLESETSAQEGQRDDACDSDGPGGFPFDGEKATAVHTAPGQEGNIDLKDIFTEDAVIASAGVAAQTNVLLQNNFEASPDSADVSVTLDGAGQAVGGEESLEVHSGRLMVEPKPKLSELYRFPPVSFLTKDPNPTTFSVTEELKTTSVRLVETLANFGVRTKIMNICCGPTVTRYELQPEVGVRVRSIQNLSDDIALHLAAPSVRIEAPIPGKDAVGIEIPNRTVSTVYLRNLIENPAFPALKSKLSVCLGMDVAGSPIYMDIAKMPHLLIAGATGMGKSVCINSFIVSLLYKARPDEVKLILIDPKKVELSIYNGIPHLLVPVVSDPKKAAGSLAWAVNEMERRFGLIEEVGVRDLASYNEATKNDPEREYIPQVVIIIDELADLMMTARDEVESSICRIAQKARAAGMHLVIGTQRPSVDVITGIIKANVPSRIAFTVASQVDSRTIIDISGAERLMGRGDMLFAPVGCLKPMRVQGSFVSEREIEEIIEFLKKQTTAEYDADIIANIEKEAARCGEKKRGRSNADAGNDEIAEEDDLFADSDSMIMPAIELAVNSGMLSTSLLQRRLSLGYARAARIVDQLEQMGIVGPFEGSKPRKVLITKEEYFEMKLKSEDKEL